RGRGRSVRTRAVSALGPTHLSPVLRQCRRKCAGSRSCDQYRARGRTVAALDSERKADELILARRWSGQVEAFDYHHRTLEKSAVSAMVARVELLDRQVIDSDQLDPVVDEVLCTVGCQIGVILDEIFLGEHPGIAGTNEYPFV